MSKSRQVRKKEKQQGEEGRNFKEKIAEVLELPKEIILNVPKLTMIGNGGLIIENYKGIIQYEENKVRVNTGIGIIKISGQHLLIKEITAENIMVEGKISSLEFSG